jgi:hypothetical protein
MKTVGRTPWSARVPLDPPSPLTQNSARSQQADEGVGRGPGGPPHQRCFQGCPRHVTRYSNSLEFNNLKNSLKSGGSWIVAIDHLTHQFERLHAFLGRFRAPVFQFRPVVINRADFKGRTIQTGRIHSVHSPILYAQKQALMRLS